MGNSSDRAKFKCHSIQLPANCKDWGFVLSLNMKPKYMVYSICAESSAYSANLRANDVLLLIDGHYVRNMKFEKIKRMLNDSLKNGHVELLTVDTQGYKWFRKMRKLYPIKKIIIKQKHIEFYSTQSSVALEHKSENRKAESASRPRVCRLERRNSGEKYGFDFVTILSEKKHIANHVRAGLPAHNAGLRDGDHILEVNGRSVKHLEHKDLVELILLDRLRVEFLVVKDLDSFSFDQT